MKCVNEGCEFNGMFAIKVCVPAIGYPQEEDRALSLVLDVNFCRKHAEEFKPSDVLDVPNEKGKTLRDAMPIFARMSGSNVPPDCDRAWTVPTRIDSKDYLKHKRIMNRG